MILNERLSLNEMIKSKHSRDGEIPRLITPNVYAEDNKTRAILTKTTNKCTWRKKNEIFQIQNGVKSYEGLWPVNTKNNEIQEKLDDFQDEKTVIILVENLEKLKGFLLLINESIYK